MELAGRGRRLLATLIDMILVPTLTVILMMAFDVIENADDYADSAWMLHLFLTAVLAYVLLNGYLLFKRGQTIGKLILGIRIVNAGDEQVPPLWKLLLVRAVFFPLLYTAVIAIVDAIFIIRRDRRCLHDLTAGTRVVRISTDAITEPTPPEPT